MELEAPAIQQEKPVGRQLRPLPKRWGYLGAKRVFDLLSSCLLLALLWPVLALIALAVKGGDGGPAFYRHGRIGQNGRPLTLWKFRTMVPDADREIARFTAAQREEWQRSYKLQRDPRVTPVGRFLRRTSLDELPQLLNVISGQMSLVGPRPVVAEELQKYGASRQQFLSAKPGLTGYWQSCGRSGVSYQWGRRQAMELYYTRKASFLLDMKILLGTAAAVLKGKGAV